MVVTGPCRRRGLGSREDLFGWSGRLPGSSDPALLGAGVGLPPGFPGYLLSIQRRRPAPIAFSEGAAAQVLKSYRSPGVL